VRAPAEHGTLTKYFAPCWLASTADMASKISYSVDRASVPS
jgi:hypothetical protein